MLTRTVIKSFTVLFAGGIFLSVSLRPAQTASQPQEPSREGLEFFEKKIRPALAENCYACHSEKSRKPQGGLLLDSIEAMLKGGASGQPAIVQGDVEKACSSKPFATPTPNCKCLRAANCPIRRSGILKPG